MTPAWLTESTLIVALTSAVSLVGFSNPRVIEALLLWPPAIDRRHEWYRLASYGVVHADLPHLAFNMITLYFFAKVPEVFFRGAFGQLGFVLFYVLALVASILPTFLRHRHDAQYRSLGASGAVSAVLFSFILFQPWSRIYVFFIPIGIPAVVYAVAYVAFEAWSQRKGQTNVNHSAHLWGAAFGVVFTLVTDPRAGLLFLARLTGSSG
jgi:membrane associated rhomboid family serine protease